MSEPRNPFNVLIAGGGIAALEAALALRELAGDRVRATLLAPEPDFVYRPLRVLEPFAGPSARHYPLEEFAGHAGVELKRDAFAWLDPVQRTVHTEGGEQLHYDALLLAMGARLQPRFRHAVTLDDRRLDEQLHGLIQDIEAGYVHRLAFIIPSPMTWPLPLYELALLTANRAYEMNEDAAVTIITPEDAPLAVFGEQVQEAVSGLLHDARIAVIDSTHAEVPEPGHVTLYPSGESLQVDRVIALPELFGPSTPGIPKNDAHGFISIDPHCRVQGLEGVFAAGDITDFPVKHGGIGAQQADVAATEIARLAGAPVEPKPWTPQVHATLLGGGRPLYLSARITGSHGSRSIVSSEPDWPAGAKIAARYLTPYLEARDHERPPAAPATAPPNRNEQP